MTGKQARESLHEHLCEQGMWWDDASRVTVEYFRTRGNRSAAVEAWGEDDDDEHFYRDECHDNLSAWESNHRSTVRKIVRRGIQ
jgi:hypothetical protein